MSFRAVLVGLAVGLALAYWYFRRSLPELVTPPPAAVAPAMDAGALAIAPIEELPLTEPQASPPPSKGPVTFDDGFCSTMGTESFRIRSTLDRALRAELRRRLQADAGEQPDTAVLREAATGTPAAELLAHAKLAAAAVPDSPFPQIAIAVAARDLELPDEQVPALRRARERLPSDPAVAFALAAATWNDADLDEAVDGLGTFIAAEPSAAASRLRARLEVQRDIQKGYHRELRDGITVLWPDGFAAAQADALAAFVDQRLDEAAALTGTRRRRALTMVVYPSRSELLAVACVRNWTAALYDGVLRVVADGAHGEVNMSVLKHETLHAQLSPLAPQAPKWFHEGLAQSFAQERKPLHMWSVMVKNRSYVPFTSLDGTFQDFAANADADLAYSQSYGMVELMRKLGGDGAIPIAVQAFQAGATTPAALAKACGKPEVTGADLLGFLETQQ